MRREFPAPMDVARRAPTINQWIHIGSVGTVSTQPHGLGCLADGRPDRATNAVGAAPLLLWKRRAVLGNVGGEFPVQHAANLD